MKVHFLGDNRKSQGWNIICAPLSVSISHYLQMQWAEISFSVHHEGINNIFTLKSITVSSFSLYYTWCYDLRLYNSMILAIIIIIMFIYSGVVVIWEPWIFICHPPVSLVPTASRWAQVRLSRGKSKSAGLKWQQCSQNEHYCYIGFVFRGLSWSLFLTSKIKIFFINH